MAHVHTKKAGQWAKGKANRILDRMLTAMLAFMAIMGIGVGYCFGRFSLTTASILAGVFMVCIWFATKPLMRRFDTMSKERLKYMRGAQAEGLVAWYLQDLPDGWHVFHNLPCAAGGDIDHVVVGPGGVFVISTKSYKGHVVQAATGTVTINGHPLTALDEAMKLGMWVRDFLRAALGQRTPWVQPVLALPMAAVNVPATGGKVWVLDDDALLETISPDPLPKDRKLSADRVKLIAAELERLTQQA